MPFVSHDRRKLWRVAIWHWRDSGSLRDLVASLRREVRKRMIVVLERGADDPLGRIASHDGFSRGLSSIEVGP